MLNIEPAGDAVGDTRQVVQLVTLFMESARLDDEAVLLVDVFQQEDVLEKAGIPCVSLAFDGFGTFPKEFSVGEGMMLTFEELQARWTLATRGGRIDVASNGLLLRLKGQRVLPEVSTDLEPLREVLEKPGVRSSLDEALQILEGSAPSELADLRALVLDVLREHREETQKRGVVCEALFASDLPPIPIRRGTLRGLFKRLLAYAVAADSPGAAVTLLFENDVARRAVVFVATVSGVQTVPGHAAFMASMRRTVEEGHQGTLEVSVDTTGVTLTVALPDPVGRTLDAWIPGFESFSEPSRKVLRLLKSGGPTPPQEILLEGVLEEELARWLLPRLETPAAVNVAHEVLEDKRLGSAAPPERLKKALDQIRKGKPRRDLARRLFAAEVVWAYRGTPGAGPLSGPKGSHRRRWSSWRKVWQGETRRLWTA